jgi:aminopeptidase-like protein
LEVARRLLAGPKPHYSYRFLFLPETLGSIAYLSKHERVIPKMLGGLFLEMLGNDAPHALQMSYQPESHVDGCLVTALRGAEPSAFVGAYRTVIDNDERQFNAPGVRVPMLSLSRVRDPHLPTSRYYPYREYHSSLDTPAIVSTKRLEASVQLVLELLSAFDRNRFIVNRFKGEVFASGFGLWVDYKADAEAHRNAFAIMDRCDGTRRPADIAHELGLSFQQVWTLVERLLAKDLVSLSHAPQPTDPHLA